TLQDAGLPVLRSLKILEHQMKPGVLKNALIDVVDDVESGSTLSEAFGKHPKCFDRLYVNMVKAGEAGGALEVILQRLADFKEKAQSLKRRVIGAMVYPVVVITVAVGILTFIMVFIIPKFKKIFDDFKFKLPDLSIVRETCTNVVFERMYQRVYESIRQGDTIAQPLKESRLVDDMVVNMVDVGEETGDLDTMLYKVADVYDEEVNVLVEGLISLLEPLMIVVLGLIIGSIVIALFLPLIKLLEGLSK